MYIRKEEEALKNVQKIIMVHVGEMKSTSEQHISYSAPMLAYLSTMAYTLIFILPC